MLREPEVAYWGHVARDIKLVDGEITDNIWKRQELVRRLLDYNWIGETVLEIGVGGGLTAAVLNLLVLGKMNYLGTDVAPEFCDYANKRWKFQMVMADVTHIPAEPAQFTRILAFDTLEHVRPEDREAGNKEIKRLLAPYGMVMLNIPVEGSAHDDEFDHGYTRDDAEKLADDAGLKIVRWEPYCAKTPAQTLNYVFAVLQ